MMKKKIIILYWSVVLVFFFGAFLQDDRTAKVNALTWLGSCFVIFVVVWLVEAKISEED